MIRENHLDQTSIFCHCISGHGFKCQLYLLMACVALAEHGHSNWYQTKTQRSAYSMPGHSPVHYTGQYVVLCDEKIKEYFIICNTLSGACIYEVIYRDTEWKLQVLYTDAAPVPLMLSTTLACLHLCDCIQYKL
jgi:hypothetical protein